MQVRDPPRRLTREVKKGAHHAYPSHLVHHCCLRSSLLERCCRAICLAGRQQTRARGSPQAVSCAARIQVHRHVFLVPGVVSPEIANTVFARGVAYGDLLTATLAFIALAALRSRFAEPLVWLFNIVGTLDLLNAFYQGNAISLANAPGVLGAAYFIPIFGVPLLLVTHVLVFRLLMRKQAAAPASVVAGLHK